MTKYLVTRTITAGNQFTDPIDLWGYFNISISGTWTGTVALQRSFDDGVTWHDIEPNGTFSVNAQTTAFEPENNVRYRIGMGAAGYSSGSVTVRLSQ